MKRYDVAVIGSGPAGLEAAISLKRKRKDFIIFGSEELSEKLVRAKEINNYLGFHKITGLELKNHFENHIKSLDIEITYERINSVYAMGDYYTIVSGEKTYEAKTIIVAVGSNYGKPLINEEKFHGKGISYCASCDAPLYSESTVAVVGYSKKSEEEAVYIANMGAKVYYISMYKNFENNILNENIKVVNEKALEVRGNEVIESLVLENSELEVEGVFILKEIAEYQSLIPGIELENGFIKVDKNMKTSLRGCFAAGDCTGRPYRFMVAASEGLIASAEAVNYLQELEM